MTLIHVVAFFFTIYLVYLGLYSKVNYTIVQIINLFINPYFLLHFLGSIILWRNLPVYLLWGIFLPFFSLYFGNKKSTLKSGLYLIFTLIMAPVISYLFHIDSYSDHLFKRFSQEQLLLLNYGTVILLFVSFLLNVYVYVEYDASEPKKLFSPPKIYASADNDQNVKDFVYQLKFDKLYDNIITYMEEKRPYTNPDIKITDIAKAVGTNKTYVSMALNKKGRKFNDLINHYRIQHAKKDLLENKKSMREIYTEAGFLYSATFNNVFEEKEGMKPYEYQYINNKKEDLE
ncbi:helix-turn-helix domain-containing protein [Chryseobacterium sp. KBW03]|uniref:helix-turn-helix domain-containing protein n=1 Tax=Chryseobacterium sp. KBW03 TaxID=2153362 RepID=UPI00162932CB|nr:helix-turn-helix domain-containing protein [Chryseobacterium sp. KBW03]